MKTRDADTTQVRYKHPLLTILHKLDINIRCWQLKILTNNISLKSKALAHLVGSAPTNVLVNVIHILLT